MVTERRWLGFCFHWVVSRNERMVAGGAGVLRLMNLCERKSNRVRKVDVRLPGKGT